MNLERMFSQIWTQRGWGAVVLLPASFLYRFLIWTRKCAYQFGFFKARKVNAIVIVVGNVVIGGAGKTPTVISVVHHLVSKGYHVGIVSRGYGRINDDCQEVMAGSTVSEVGDEPMMLKLATKVPVFVGRNRALIAAELLLKHPQVKIIVADDGLQHFGLYRDIEICVFDDRGLGNAWLLPAGPLREAWPRETVHCIGERPERFLVLHTGNHPAFKGHKAKRKLARHGVRLDGTTVLLENIDKLGGKPILALAGIAKPKAFFDLLTALGMNVDRFLPLPDHFAFDHLMGIDIDAYQILCTEKDALKLWQLAPNAIAIPLVQIVEPDFFSALDANLAECMGTTLSSRNGH